MTPHDILRKYYGYRSFRTHQLEIIESIIRGQDAFVLMPTGSGKSICYQIPSILRPGVGLVVSPLIALDREERGQGERSAVQEVQDSFGLPVISVLRLRDLLTPGPVDQKESPAFFGSGLRRASR